MAQLQVSYNNWVPNRIFTVILELAKAQFKREQKTALIVKEKAFTIQLEIVTSWLDSLNIGQPPCRHFTTFLPSHNKKRSERDEGHWPCGLNIILVEVYYLSFKV